MPCPPPTYCLQVTIQGTGAPTRPARVLWAPAVGGDQPPRFTDEETEAGPSRATPEPRCSASLTSKGTKLWGPRSMGTGRGRWGLGRAGGKGRLRRSPPEGPAWAGHWPVPQFLSLSCEDEGTQWIHPPPLQAPPGASGRGAAQVGMERAVPSSGTQAASSCCPSQAGQDSGHWACGQDSHAGSSSRPGKKRLKIKSGHETERSRSFKTISPVTMLRGKTLAGPPPRGPHPRTGHTLLGRGEPGSCGHLPP